MAKFFIAKKYVSDVNTPVSTDFVVSGEVKGDKITLSMTNQRSFEKETWEENSDLYLPVEYVKYQGYMVNH